MRFLFEQDGAYASSVTPSAGPAGPAEDTSDLDPEEIVDWSYEELGRAWRSGLLARLPASFWDGLATGGGAGEAER